MRFSFQAASETVSMFNSLFGSTETSRAVTHLVYLVQQEILLHDPGFATRSGVGNVVGAVALSGGIAKAVTAYACLQVMTRERTLQARKVARLIEESVVVGEEDGKRQNGVLATVGGAVGWIAGGIASGVGIRGNPNVVPPASPQSLERIDFEARRRKYQWQRGFKSEKEFVKAMETVRVWNESFGDAPVTPPAAVATASTSSESTATISSKNSPQNKSNVFRRFAFGGYIQAPLTIRNTDEENTTTATSASSATNSILEDISATSESDVFEDAKSFISLSVASSFFEEPSHLDNSASHPHHEHQRVKYYGTSVSTESNSTGRSLHRISMQSLRSIFEDEQIMSSSSAPIAEIPPPPTEVNDTVSVNPSSTTTSWRLFDYVKSWIPSSTATNTPAKLYNSTKMPGGFMDEFEESQDLNIGDSVLEYSLGVNTVFDQVHTFYYRGF
ncbi:UNVERIFIED_CONTAM: hypothetical protein HDU68_011759 [Siphonaria sp. JEL0065]|nr:hypothetical protein HDU68_011759 [Siphonaria sp. JEL0065]